MTFGGTKGLRNLALEQELLLLDEPDDAVDKDDEFLHCNILRGFVELGFSSASPDLAVAHQYAGQCDGSCLPENGYCSVHRATILEIDTGQVDRGKGSSACM